MKNPVKANMLKLQAYYLFSFFAVGSLTPLLSVYLKESEKMNGYQIGTIMSIGPIIMIIFQPIWGMVCDISGKPSKVLSLTAFFAGFLGLGYLVLHSYFPLVILAACLAVFQSAIIPVSDSISLKYTAKEGGNYGNIRLFGSLGFGIAVFVMGRLSETPIGLTVIFYAFFIGLTAAAGLALRLPEETAAVKIKPGTGMKELFSIPRFVIFLIITFLVFGPNLANNVYYGLFVEARGGTYTGIGIAFLLAVLSEIPFMRLAGRWIHQWGLLPVALMAACASLLRWTFYFYEPGLTLVYISSIVSGFSLGLFIPAGLQYISKIVPAHITVTAVTIYSAFGNGLGNWFSTFAGGILLENSGIYSVYLLFAGMSLLGMLLTVWLILKEKSSVKAPC